MSDAKQKTTYSFSNVSPSKFTFSVPKTDGGIMTRSWVSPNLSLKFGDVDDRSKVGIATWDVSTPYNASGQTETWAEYDEKVDKRIRGEGERTSVAQNITVRITEEAYEEYSAFFNELAANVASHLEKQDKLFSKKMTSDMLKASAHRPTPPHRHRQTTPKPTNQNAQPPFSQVMFSSPVGRHKTADYPFLRVNIDPDGLPSSPTIRLYTGMEEDEMQFEAINVKDLRSARDGGRGVLRNAEIVGIVEDAGGIWVKTDGSLGIKLRLAQMLVFPKSGDEGASAASADRAERRSVDALTALLPGKRFKAN